MRQLINRSTVKQVFSLPKLTALVGIDLGSSRTRIWCQGIGMVVDEPSVIAINVQTNQVMAVGQEASEMAGRVKSDIVLIKPISQGKLADDSAAKAMLRVWLQKMLGWRYVFSPVVMVSVAATSTQAERQAIVELIYDLGAKEVFTIAQPLAAAIGAGVPIADASGTLVCQLGEGLVESALISLGSLVQSQSTTQAGAGLIAQLIATVKAVYNLAISQETAKSLLLVILPFSPQDQSMMLVGQEMVTLAPQEIVVKFAQLTQAITPTLDHYLQLIKKLLALIPPELTSDVLDKGMLLTGGLSQLNELDAWLTTQLGIPVAVVENPSLVVIEGISTALNHLSAYKRSLSYDQDY